jgi:hypothetical protein
VTAAAAVVADTIPETEFSADPAEERFWYFTFAPQHRMIITSDRHSRNVTGVGVPLVKRFVRIFGTHEAAYSQMCRLFGINWAEQYPDAEMAGVELHGLTELVITA